MKSLLGIISSRDKCFFHKYFAIKTPHHECIKTVSALRDTIFEACKNCTFSNAAHVHKYSNKSV